MALQNSEQSFSFSHVKELKPETLDEILNTLIKGLIILEGDLKKVLTEKQTTEIRVRYLNTVKIFIYLIVEFSNFMENKQVKEKDSDLMPIAGGKVRRQISRSHFQAALFVRTS